MSRRVLVVAAIALLSTACTRSVPVVHPPESASPATIGAARGDRGIQEPLPTAPPLIGAKDFPSVRAAKLGRFMEERWPRVHLRPDANALGTVAAFEISIDYDPYRGDERAWEDGVRSVSGDLREASVELLQLAVKYFPRLRWATVWEDRRLIFFWSKRQIEHMGPPSSYRDFDDYQALTRLAAFQPPLLVLARQRISGPQMPF